jgi:gag-polypeptide of LTR copia-type
MLLSNKIRNQQHPNSKKMAPQPETSTKLTNVTLSDLNHQSWVRAIKISLKGRGKLGYVTGTIKKQALSIVPTEAELTTLEEWEM